MLLTTPAIIALIFIVAFICLVFGIYAGSEMPGKWKFCVDELPLNNGRVIVNYPVAFFDDEFGIVVDQAEYHPNRPHKWLTVPDGDPCTPFAWYDLPYPPHPRIPTRYRVKGGVDTYA